MSEPSLVIQPVVIQPESPVFSPIGDHYITPLPAHDGQSDAQDNPETEEYPSESALETNPQKQAHHGEIRSEGAHATVPQVSLDGLLHHFEQVLAGAFAVASHDDAAHATHTAGMSNNVGATHSVRKEHPSLHPAAMNLLAVHWPSYQVTFGSVSLGEHEEESHVPSNNDIQEFVRVYPQHRQHELSVDTLRWEHTPNIIVPPRVSTTDEAVEAIDAQLLQFTTAYDETFHLVGAESETRHGRPLIWCTVSLLLVWCSWSVQQPQSRRPSRYLGIRYVWP